MSGAADASDPKLAFEVVKLLLQVVWADGEVAREEAAALHDFAVRSGVEMADIETLDGCLTRESPLPLPNLGLLRDKRTEVLREVQRLLVSDERIHEEEEATLQQISELLR